MWRCGTLRRRLQSCQYTITVSVALYLMSDPHIQRRLYVVCATVEAYIEVPIALTVITPVYE